MEQFNLQKYVENPHREVITRNGQPARIICTCGKCSDFLVIAFISTDDGEILEAYDENGRCGHFSPGTEDLFFAPQEQ